MTLGGTLIIRNGIAYDFCFQAAVRSLLGVCDEVVVVDGFSDDGTHEALQQMAHGEPRLRVLQRAWLPTPLGTWLSDLTNQARTHLTTGMHINLQADEVLHENDYKLLRELANTGRVWTLERLNFWLNARHLLPPNEKVGSTIVRLAPTTLPCVGDAQGLAHEQGWERSAARIFHYGFIRHAKALVAKARPMQQAFFGTQDSIWDEVERVGLKALGDTKHATAVPRSRLVPFVGKHPEMAREWLWQHGYAL
jgi:hypothetical protein